MVKHLMTQQATEPTVYVTKGRQRVKQYSGHGNGSVYLKNGEEFELELFNPTTNKILAKISINGKSLGAGMVIRPGERVFLERYFDEAKKFLFETYVVDGADYNAQQAIKLNGIVEVEFYNQSNPVIYQTVTYQPVTYQTVTTWPANSDVYRSGVFYNATAHSRGTLCGQSIGSKSYVDNISANSVTCSTGSVGLGTSAPSATLTVNDATMTFGGACDFSGDLSCEAPAMQPVETGRVEKGSYSDQGFITDSTSFNSYYSWKTTWTILPESQRPVVIEDLSVYCTNCGAKRKKSNHKFCPNCGGKF